MRRTRAFVVLLLLVSASTGCNLSGDDQTFAVNGTVQFLEVEGGCWSILGTDSARYEPIKLPTEFRQDGLAVRAILTLRRDLVSVCQIGRIVEIVNISRRGSAS